jgi:hypothetical protein
VRNPEQILTKEALTQEATVHNEPEENIQLQILQKTLKDMIGKEATSQMFSEGGDATGILTNNIAWFNSF